jgi:hypothetical protein
MAEYDAQKVRSDLLALCKSASHLSGWNKEDADQYIRVGEYPLALDSVAYAYLENDTPMPDDRFAMFVNLAAMMQLEGDPEYDGVARLRARVKQTPG